MGPMAGNGLIHNLTKLPTAVKVCFSAVFDYLEKTPVPLHFISLF